MSRLRPVNLQSPVNWQHPINRGLRAWWMPLTQPGWIGGQTFRDLCRRHDGTLTNMPPTWQGLPTHADQRALRFDQSDDRVDVTRPAVTAYPCSLAATIYVPSSYGNYSNGWIVGVHTRNTANNRIGLTFNNGASVRAIRVVTHNAQTAITYDVTGSGRDERLDILVTIPGTGTGAMTLYLNGESVATGTAVNPTNTPDYSVLGAKQDVGAVWNQFFGGMIASAQIWNRALSAAEADALHKEAHLGYPTLLNRMRRTWYVPQEEAVSANPFFYNRYVLSRGTA
jgi:hypothetical protein